MKKKISAIPKILLRQIYQCDLQHMKAKFISKVIMADISYSITCDNVSIVNLIIIINMKSDHRK
jgi:hypothetical protein